EPPQSPKAPGEGGPGIDVEVDDHQSRGRQTVAQARPVVRVPVANERQRELMETGVVTDQQQRTDLGLGFLHQLKELAGTGLIETRLVARRCVLVEGTAGSPPGLICPARR